MASPRNIVFSNGYTYHIFNRGVERRQIFNTARDRERFLSLLDYYRFENVHRSYSHYLALPLKERVTYRSALEQEFAIVDIYAFCLMPNHFHLLLHQNTDGGIQRYLSLVSNAYAKYFNTKNQRVGPLFQGSFKAVLVESSEQLIHLSRYIHINPVVSSNIVIQDLVKYSWSSFPDYLNIERTSFVTTRPILSYFNARSSYKDFVFNQVAYAKELEKVKHLVLEEV